jgi:c-di-GMP-binding flagellar brake protein YcgR
MLLTELTRLGDKIDIQLIQQLEMKDRGDLDGGIRTYKSSVFDFISDRELEISMPTENGRMVLFQTGLRVRLLFYTKKGLYTCDATVQRRYKKENFFVLAMQLVSEPKKFQRREFFRIEYMLDMKYLPVTEEVARINTTEHLFMEISKPEYIDRYHKAVTLDLSGGGLRFASDAALAEGALIVSQMRLTNDNMDQNFFLVTRIVSCEPAQGKSDKFNIRGQFIFKNLRDREMIVRFVADEERRIRRKEIG